MKLLKNVHILKLLSVQFKNKFINSKYFGSKSPEKLCPEKPVQEYMLAACQTVVLFGGTGEIGTAIAKKLVKRGARCICIVGRNEEKAKQIIKNLNCKDGNTKVMFSQTNVQHLGAIEGVLKKVEEKTCANVNVVINAAGSFNPSEYEKEININLIGATNTTIAAKKYFSDKKTKGLIINIAGIFGVSPFAGAPTLAAAQHGIVGLSRSFGDRSHYDLDKVRVVALCPGMTETSFFKEATKKIPCSQTKEIFKKVISCNDPQNASVCGDAVIHLIQFADSGSIWAIEKSKLYKIDIPDHQDMYKFITSF